MRTEMLLQKETLPSALVMESSEREKKATPFMKSLPLKLGTKDRLAKPI